MAWAITTPYRNEHVILGALSQPVQKHHSQRGVSETSKGLCTRASLFHGPSVISGQAFETTQLPYGGN